MENQAVSVVIPARNAAPDLKTVLQAIFAQQIDRPVEVIVVSDGSTDATVEVARQFPCRVIETGASSGNPARARNIGADAANGDPIVFLDADCTPRVNWLRGLLTAHAAGNAVVGGAIDMPTGMSFTARADYLCGFYLVHSKRPGGPVPHHPPPNLSFTRDAYLASGGFSEKWPFYYTNEEREPLARLRESGCSIAFEPTAIVEHRNRPGFLALLRRHYRWGFTAIESKHSTRSTRMAWLYRWPVLTVIFVPALVAAQSVLIIILWLRYAVFEVLLHIPTIIISRIAYGLGMIAGAIDWQIRRLGGVNTGKRWRLP